MGTEGIVYACCSDISGMMRGKGFAASAWDQRVASGVGWTPTNVQITCFDTIVNEPFGSLGDVVLIPDPATRVRLNFDDGGPIEDFCLGDIKETDGQPWFCCTRTILKAALERLERVAGLSVLAAFEHEFHLKDAPERALGGFTLGGFRSERPFAESLFAALRANDLAPSMVVNEYGANQLEVTLEPQSGVRSADHAALVREIVRACAERVGGRASFTPIRGPTAVGNGVHVHLSLRDQDDRPVMYDPAGPHGLSSLGGAFAAGILRHLPEILAFTAPSRISYARLTPHRWSAAFNNLGFRDREAALRVCPVITAGGRDPAAQFNIEYRAADAAACPHLAMAALVHAGAAGIEAGLATPQATEDDLSRLDVDALAARGFVRLPTRLDAALALLEASTEVTSWYPSGFIDAYLGHKRGELAFLEDKDEAEIFRAYEAVY